MRAYFFVNSYISDIQRGIQPLHCIVDLIYKYRLDSSIKPKVIDDWATNHKTVIVLNGGNSASLQDLHFFFMSKENPFPFAKFHEDEQSLNGALTSVGIILPERIYDSSRVLRDRRTTVTRIEANTNIITPAHSQPLDYEFSDWEIELMNKMNQFGLA